MRMVFTLLCIAANVAVVVCVVLLSPIYWLAYKLEDFYAFAKGFLSFYSRPQHKAGTNGRQTDQTGSSYFVPKGTEGSD